LSGTFAVTELENPKVRPIISRLIISANQDLGFRAPRETSTGGFSAIRLMDVSPVRRSKGSLHYV
jgi:hypothetical protein